MRRKIRFLITLSLLIGATTVQAQQQPSFDEFFTDATLRVDYLRQGCFRSDTCMLRGYSVQNTLWAGSKTQLLDPIDNGYYRIMVKDAATGREIYSRTYNSLFHEYRDTKPGLDSVATFEEVALMPMPRRAVDICLQKRGSDNRFATAATFRFDPSTDKPAKNKKAVKAKKLHYNGDSHTKIDVVIVAEGYSKKDATKMKNDFAKFTSFLLAQEPFKSRACDFNVWGIGYLADESGVTDPTKNRHVNSAVGSSYNTFGSDRYLMTMNLFRLHDLLAGCPYDHIIIMANCDTYGGGAIYNFYAFSAVQEMSRWILPHELGHSIGGLADEYVDLELSYNEIHRTDVEPIEPNITTMVDFQTKWQDLVAPGTPVPTPPAKDLKQRDNGPVGLYEGAGYKANGIYRPCTKCMMRDYANFCPVCFRTLNKMFDLYTH